MISDYLIQRRLGEGSFGVVFQAKHQQTAKKVAIKVTTEIEATKEYEILTKLHHPSIIHAIDLVSVPAEVRPKLAYDKGLILDYLPGGDLIEFVTKAGRLSERTSMKFLVQILMALHHCHKRRIAHRDIKPDNILINSEGNLVLCDFGLATVCPPHRPLHGREGSLLYCAPEILRDLPYYGHQTDMWSAGVVFYCMLTGCIPWDGFDVREQTSNAMFGHYHKLYHVSKECTQILSWMLSVDPRARPTASALIKSLQHLLKDEVAIPKTPSLSLLDEADEDDASSEKSNDHIEDQHHQEQPEPEPQVLHHTYCFREAKQAEMNHSFLYQMVYEEPENLCRYIEQALENLHITFTTKERKKSWFHSPCFKYKCKNGTSRFDIEICVPTHSHSDTKIVLCRKIKGDHDHAMELLNQLYNKLTSM